MSKILVNPNSEQVVLQDVGVTVAGNSEYTIPPQDYPIFAASSDTIKAIASEPPLLIVNDGGNDIIVISDAVDLIKGWPIQATADEETTFFFDYSEIPVGAGPHSIFSQIVSPGTTLDLTRFYVTCRMVSYITLLKNGLVISTLETGAASPMASFDWRPNNVCAAGDSIEIIFTKRVGAPDVNVGVHLMGVTKITI